MIEDNSKVNIKIYNSNTESTTIMPLEETVKLLLGTQINIDFHLELIKAQAIIARTQLVKKAKAFAGSGCEKNKDCDICSDAHCMKILEPSDLMALWGEKYSEAIEKINKAVDETKGLIITLNNKAIDAKYHDTCGGATENSENVLGNRVIYLRKVLCDYCTNSPNWEGYKDISVKELEEKLKIKFPSESPTLNSEIKGFIENIIRDEHGRVISIEIGGKEFDGKKIMEMLNLDSTRFSITPISIRFNTSGKGHGLGLCQYGGNQMAVEGYNYQDIINYYFTGVDIKKIEAPCIKKPLSGKILVIDPGHGGDDSQDFIGPTGLREKEVVLGISTRLREYLRELGAVVYLTRERDEYISLSKRAELGNQIRPNFFISLHLNSFSNPAIHGCEIYQFRNDKDSEALGKSIMESLVKNAQILDRGIKSADLFLLREIGVSTLVIEVDYLTNPEAEEKLKDDIYIDKIAKSITEAIVNYYKY